MGYRSEVAIALDNEYVDEFRDIIKEHNMESVFTEHDQKSFMVFKTDSIKWNTNYPEIEAIESFFNIVLDEDYGFLRVGEDFDDIEEQGMPWDYGLSVRRTIEIR